MNDNKQLQAQIDELRVEVRVARAEARFALTQAETARWCSTQIAHALLDMLAKRDVVTRTEVRSHLEATLAGMKPHLKQAGMRELAKEFDLLARKFSGAISAAPTRPSVN